MQEIFPWFGPRGVISPAVLGELSRRLASRFAGTEPAIGQHRAGIELQRAVVPQLGSGIGRVAKHLYNRAFVGHYHHCVALVGIDPDVAIAVESDAVRAFEQRMCDEQIIQARVLA